MRKAIVISVVFIVISIWVGFELHQADTIQEELSEEEVVTVVATIFPLYDIVGNVIGDHHRVTLMLAPGASPHTFSPKPQLLKDIYEADLVFTIGGVDDWILPFAESEEKEVSRVDVGIPYLLMEDHEHEGVEEHDEADIEEGEEHADESHEDLLNDPHYWLSVENAMIMVSNVAAELSRIDPNNTEQYLANAAKYRVELADLDDRVEKKLANVAQFPVLMFHGGWNYFAEQYGVTIAGVFEPVPGREPLPQDVEELYEVVAEEGVIALFTEPQLATDAYKPVALDLGLQVYTLDPIGGVEGRATYIELMEYNAETVRGALLEI